ncbi:MAG: response regulator [Spirochaetes bacterium]|nr:response regulator [Spirochaetota bacterium]
MVRVLVIDRDTHSHRTLRSLLPDRFCLVHHTEPALSVDRARLERPDLVILDIDLGAFDGLALLRSLVAMPNAAPVLVLTSLRHTRLVVQAVRTGAADYLTKPFVLDELIAAMIAALERRPRPPATAEAAEYPALTRIIGESRAAYEQRSRARLFAESSAPVMILGESGTGKDLFARVVHALSSRARGAYVAVNCGAVPESLFESEMFGVTRGAYTDAIDRPGHFEEADGGTLLLDEIGELSPRSQVKLLRALEERRVRRVGSTAERKIDVRVIAASNRPLRTDVETGRFRADLFYRLNILSVELAPLRERSEDIAFLAHHFLQGSRGVVPQGFTDAALETLRAHPWPGNIRELRNLVERAELVADGNMIRPADVMFV